MWINARNLVLKLNRLLQDVTDEAALSEVLDDLSKTSDRLKRPLINRPKSATDRATVSKVGEEVAVPGGQKVTVDEQLRNETLIISDIFQMNELDALELLLTGELQTRNFHGLSRGLCAVVCYYDTHRYFLLTLKTLLESLADAESAETLPSKLRSFTAGLVSDEELFFRVITILNEFSVQQEFERLNQPNVNGLGGPHHQRLLTTVISEMEAYAYEILCLLSILLESEKVPLVLPRLFSVVQRIAPEGAITPPQLSVLTALLLFVHPPSFRVGSTSTQTATIFREQLKQRWEHPCIRATVSLALGVFLKLTRPPATGSGRVTEDTLINEAINGQVLKFLHAYVVRAPGFSKYTYSFDVVDFFVKNLVVHFPAKIQEMFNICEEELEAIDESAMDDSAMVMPSFPLHFNVLLELITELYRVDTPKALEHSGQFFDHRHEGLCNFIVAGKAITAPLLFVSYINMLQVLCKTQMAAAFLFSLFRSETDSPYNWDHLFRALRRYLELFRVTPSFGSSMSGFPTAPTHDAIQQSELAGILSWLRLAESVVTHDAEARRLIYEDRGYNSVETMIGMVAASFPIVLKGAIYRFLAALSADQRAAVHIWNSIFAEGVCTFDPESGNLVGLQQELEEKECAAKNYDSSCGFLRLMKTLFSQQAIPSGQQLAPYMQFIAKSIIGQFSMRSYDDATQMACAPSWDMATTAVDTLNELLKRFVVSEAAVQTMTVQVTVLSHMLNDSPLSQSISRIILEAADRIEDSSPQNEYREALSLAAIRLLWSAVAHRSALADSVRSTDSTLIISSIEALLLSPLPMRPTTNYLSLLMTFVSHEDTFALHTFYVVKILRELCSARPSLQSRIVFALMSKRQALIEAFARITSITCCDMEAGPSQLPPHYADGLTTARVHGETVRQILEVFIESLETDPASTNVAYLLLGLNLQNIQESVLRVVDANGESLTCLRSFIELLEIFIVDGNPFDLPYAALFEPVLRLLHQLLSTKSAACDVILRYLRSEHDIICRLVACPTFRYVTEPHPDEARDDTFCRGLYRRVIQGIILQIAGIEMFTLLRAGHIKTPERLLVELLSVKCTGDETLTSEDYDNFQVDEDKPVLWRLLEVSVMAFNGFQTPSLDKFKSLRMQQLLKMSMRPSTFGVMQYDVEHLQFLLSCEVSGILNDELVMIEKERQHILNYCTEYNALRLLETSCVRLLSGWVAFVNVLASFIPIPFLDMEDQKNFLQDGLSLLTDCAETIEMNVEVISGVSSCIFRIVRAICQISLAQELKPAELKPKFAPVVTTLLECLTASAYNQCMRFKMDMYGSLLCIFDACGGAETENAPALTATERAQKLSLVALIDEHGSGGATSRNQWIATFSEKAAPLVDFISSDITLAPFTVKLAAITTLSYILSESVDAENLAFQLTRSGTLRYVIESLMEVKPALSKANGSEEAHQAHTYIMTVLTLLARLSSTTRGWTSLTENGIFACLRELDLWTNPPTEEECEAKSKSVFLRWILSPLKPPPSAAPPTTA